MESLKISNLTIAIFVSITIVTGFIFYVYDNSLSEKFISKVFAYSMSKDLEIKLKEEDKIIKSDLKQDLCDLKKDMNKRFDRIESLIITHK